MNLDFTEEQRLIDKTLLLTVRCIGGLFYRVKGYFALKNRGW